MTDKPNVNNRRITIALNLFIQFKYSKNGYLAKRLLKKIDSYLKLYLMVDLGKKKEIYKVLEFDQDT